MPQVPDDKEVILTVYQGDRITVWIDDNSVWAMTGGSAGSLLVATGDGPLKGISDKHWVFEVKGDVPK